MLVHDKMQTTVERIENPSNIWSAERRGQHFDINVSSIKRRHRIAMASAVLFGKRCYWCASSARVTRNIFKIPG